MDDQIHSTHKTKPRETKKTIARSTVKDSVFRDLFKQPEYLLQLYRVLHPEDTETVESDLNTVTIDNILTDRLYNDLGFTVRDKLLILTEAQSSWSVNIIIRLLFYLAETWNDHIQLTEQNRYGSRKLNLPEPEFYVVYSGDKNIDSCYSLAKEYFGGNDKFIDLKVRILHEQSGNDIVSQYIGFSKVYSEQFRLHGKTMQTITETLRICKDKELLSEYLKSREREVTGIMRRFYTQEDAIEMFGKEKYAEGVESGKRSSAIGLSRAGISIDTIAKGLNESPQTIEMWLTEA